jgi:hypothetical protein
MAPTESPGTVPEPASTAEAPPRVPPRLDAPFWLALPGAATIVIVSVISAKMSMADWPPAWVFWALGPICILSTLDGLASIWRAKVRPPVKVLLFGVHLLGLIFSIVWPVGWVLVSIGYRD